MKALVCTALSACMLIATVISPAQAQPANSDQPVSQIVATKSQPIESFAADTGMATHLINVKVQGNPIAQLSIGLPPGLKVTQGIQVTARPNQPLQAASSINSKTAVVNFSQPVSPGTTVRIALRGIYTPNESDFWLYPISVKSVGTTEAIPIGTARVETYSDD